MYLPTSRLNQPDLPELELKARMCERERGIGRCPASQEQPRLYGARSSPWFDAVGTLAASPVKNVY